MSDNRKIIKNIFSNWTGYIVSVFIGLILSPIVVHSLGDQLYGMWTVIASFGGYYGLVAVGIVPSATLYLNRYYSKNDTRGVEETASTALVIFSILSVIVVIISCIVAYFGTFIFQISDNFVHDFRLAVILMGVNFAVGFVFIVFQSFLIVLQRFDVHNAIQIFSDVLRAVLIGIFITKGYGIVTIAFITMSCSLIQYVGFTLAVYHLYPKDLLISVKLASLNKLKMMGSYGVYTFIGALSRQVMFYSNAIIIGIFMETSLITYFAIANNLIEYSKNLLGAMTRVFFPVAIERHTRSEIKGLQALFLSGSKYSFMLGILIAIGFYSFGKTFLDLWMGTQYGSECYKVLAVLTLGYIPFYLSYTSYQIMHGMGKAKKLAIISSIGALMNISLSVILIKPYGIIGVAWGITISLYFNSLLVIISCLRELGINAMDYSSYTVIRPIICAVPVGVFGYLYFISINIEKWWDFIFHVILVTLLYVCSSYFICIDKMLRQRINIRLFAILGGRLH